MTWVIAGNCFNGFACVADIQMTLRHERRRKPDRHFNCLKKVHVICNNLCIAFSGDVRTGLLLIELLKQEIPGVLKEGEYFDLEGQTEELVRYLKAAYEAINPHRDPYAELIFAWNAQSGEEIFFRPFCMRIKFPEFQLSTTAEFESTAFGSGAVEPGYSEIRLFLNGLATTTPQYKAMFGDLGSEKRIWTVSKLKNLAVKHASEFELPGVSKSMVSCLGTIDYAGIYAEKHYSRIEALFSKVGIERHKEATSRDLIVNHVLSVQRMQQAVLDLQEDNPIELQAIFRELHEIYETRDYSSVARLPAMHEEFHACPGEPMDTAELLGEWDSVHAFLDDRKIPSAACAMLA